MSDLTVDYRYKVLEVPHTSDGDTFDVKVKLDALVDFGFSFTRLIDGGFHETRVRLAKIDTWEKRGDTLQIAKEAQIYATKWLHQAMGLGDLHMITEPDKNDRDKMGNFRRYLATFESELMMVSIGGVDMYRHKFLHEGLRANGFEKLR